MVNSLKSGGGITRSINLWFSLPYTDMSVAFYPNAIYAFNRLYGSVVENIRQTVARAVVEAHHNDTTEV